SPASFGQLTTLDPVLRAPANLTVTSNAGGTTAVPGLGDITLAASSSIQADPGAAVRLATTGTVGNVLVNGSIVDPAGAITLQVANPSAVAVGGDVGYIPGQQILVASGASLDARAFAQINTNNPLGYREGSVLPGGTISLQANKGDVVVDPNATLDVSGTAAT